jgi:hypothetical protein
MSCDIVHAQRGFRRRLCGDFVNRFTEGGTQPMDREENMQLPTGNEIRALPDQPSLSDDSFGLASEIRPLVGRGRGEEQQQL